MDLDKDTPKISTRGTQKSYANRQTIIYSYAPLDGILGVRWVYAVDVVVSLITDLNAVGAEVTVRGPMLNVYDNVENSYCNIEHTYFTVTKRNDTLSEDGKTGSVRFKPTLKWQNGYDSDLAFLKVTVIIGAVTQPKYEMG